MTIRPLDNTCPDFPKSGSDGVVSHNLEVNGCEVDDREARLARLGLLPPAFAVSAPRESAVPDALPTSVLRQLSFQWLAASEALLQSPGTLAGKRGALDKFFWWLEQERREYCGQTEIQGFLAYVATAHTRSDGRWGRGRNDPEAARFHKPVTARTIKYYYTYLRGLFSWLEENGYLEAHGLARNPMRGVKIARPKKPLIQPFNEEQVEMLIKTARRGTMPRRDEAIFTFLLDTGLRAAELCNVRLCDLEFRQVRGQVKLRGKGDKERIVPFGRRAKTRVWNYLLSAPRRGSDKIFVAERGWRKGEGLTPNGLLQLFHRTGRAAGISGVRCSPHTMRHTFAINFLRNGGDIRTLAYLMGHESLHITMGYLKIAEADADEQHRLYSPADAMNI